jgi:hypothetical protein
MLASNNGYRISIYNSGETRHFEKQCLLLQQRAEFKCRGLYEKQSNNYELQNLQSGYLKTKQT